MARVGSIIAAAFIAAALFWSRKSYAGDTFDNLTDEGALPEGTDMDANLRAFLYMIRLAEHARSDVETDRDWRVTAGSSLAPSGQFWDMSDHPTLSGEWMGVPLPENLCRAAGFGPGCKSTAAGAYQITAPTWREFRAAGTWGPYLQDFTPENQSEAARRILARVGALPFIYSGDIETAIARASTRWASLPGSIAQQNPRSLDAVLAFYNEGLQVA